MLCHFHLEPWSAIVTCMDNLQDILAKRFTGEPPEIRIIKDYIREKFDEQVGVAVQTREIIITVRSASLAGALRAHLRDILEQCNITDKRLILRISTVN